MRAIIDKAQGSSVYPMVWISRALLLNLRLPVSPPAAILCINLQIQLQLKGTLCRLFFRQPFQMKLSKR